MRALRIRERRDDVAQRRQALVDRRELLAALDTHDGVGGPLLRAREVYEVELRSSYDRRRALDASGLDLSRDLQQRMAATALLVVLGRADRAVTVTCLEQLERLVEVRDAELGEPAHVDLLAITLDQLAHGERLLHALLVLLKQIEDLVVVDLHVRAVDDRRGAVATDRAQLFKEALNGARDHAPVLAARGASC